MKKGILLFAVAALIAGCSTMPDHPVSYSAANGESWVFSYRGDAFPGSIHLMINGEIVASGSFGIFFGNKASGTGTYLGHNIYFQANNRAKPSCIVYIDGKEAVKLNFNGAKSTALPASD